MADNLYCPRCAQPFTVDTSFCRTCGLDLSSVTRMVYGDAENAPAPPRQPNFGVFRWGLGVFILGLVIGVLNGVLKDFQLFPERYGKLVFLIFIAAGLLMLGLGFLFPVKKYSRRKPPVPDSSPAIATAPPPPGHLPAADTNPIIFPVDKREPAMAEPGSITDATTRSLK